jgi:hypothetical protein
MGLHPWNPGNAKGKFTVAYDGVIQKFTVATTV